MSNENTIVTKDLKIFAKSIDDKSKSQIDLLLAQSAFKNCKVRIMPDVHAGAGCVIGFTANLGDKVIPNIVGVDIGCGMYTVPLGNIDIDFAKLDTVIRENIPSGMCVRKEPLYYFDLQRFVCYGELSNKEWIANSIGTLGGGNHFIEIDTDQDGYKYLIVHTGSRNLGKQVAEIYQERAIHHCHSYRDERKALIDKLKAEGREKDIEKMLIQLKAETSDKIPAALCYLEGIDRDNYLSDMKLCQEFAQINREMIAAIICKHMRWKQSCKSFHTIHNYIDDENMVRKGAISAKAGQPLLIPMNMRDGCILGEGLGNVDWNESAPHGAGRIMSRTQAKDSISLETYKKSMFGIFTTSVDMSTIDEAPQAYKSMDEIMECIVDTVKVKQILKPIYNFKASEV